MKSTVASTLYLVFLAGSVLAGPQACDPNAKSLPPTQYYPNGNGTDIHFPCTPGKDTTVAFLDSKGCDHPDMSGVHDVIAFAGVSPTGYGKGDQITFGCPQESKVDISITWEHDTVPLKWHVVPNPAN